MDQFINSLYLVIDNPVSFFFILFLSSVLNTFFPPIPIELGAVFAGYLASTGHGTLGTVMLATIAGMTLGSIAVYFLARIYGTSLLLQEPFNRIVKRESFDNASKWFQKYGIWSFFIAKTVPGMNFCAVVASGVLRLSPGRALTGIALSNAVVFCILIVLGHSVGEGWREAYGLAGRISAGAAVLIALTLAIVLLRYRWKRQQR